MSGDARHPVRARRWWCVVALLVSGCSAGHSPLGVHTAGVPSGFRSVLTPDANAVGVNGAGQLVVVTWGSSSCPALPVRVGVDGTGRLLITTETDGGACTADLSPTTSVVGPPAGFDRAASNTARLDGVEVPLLSF